MSETFNWEMQNIKCFILLHNFALILYFQTPETLFLKFKWPFKDHIFNINLNPYRPRYNLSNYMWPKTVFFFYFHLQNLRKWALRAWISLSLSPSLLIIINAIISRWGWAVLIRALSMLPDVAAFISYTLTETLKNVSIKHSSSSLDLSLSFGKLHYSSLALTLFYCCFYFSPSG